MQKKYISLFLLLAIFISSCSSITKSINSAYNSDNDSIQDRRSAGRILDDSTIKAKLKNTINRDHILKNANLHFMVYNGVALITGEIPTSEAMNHLNKTTKTIKNFGMKKIINEVDIMPNVDYFSKAKDIFINSQANNLLQEQEEFNSKHVQILTTRKIVYLMGMVTKEESEYIVNQVAKTKSIDKIVILFEYLKQIPAAEAEYYKKQKYYLEQKIILENQKKEILKQQKEIQKEIDILNN